MLTIREFSDRTGVSYRTVQAWCAEGRFTGVKRSDDGRVLLPDSALSEVRPRKRGRKTAASTAATTSPVPDTALYVRIPDESHHAEGVASVVRCASRCRAEGWRITGNPYADCGTVGGAHRAMGAMLGNHAVKRIVTPGMDHLTGGDPAAAFLLDLLLKERGITVITLDGEEKDGTSRNATTSTEHAVPVATGNPLVRGNRPTTSGTEATRNAPRNTQDHPRSPSCASLLLDPDHPRGSSPSPARSDEDHPRGSLAVPRDVDAPDLEGGAGAPSAARARVVPVRGDGEPVGPDDDGDDAGWDYTVDETMEHDPWWGKLLH